MSWFHGYGNPRKRPLVEDWTFSLGALALYLVSVQSFESKTLSPLGRIVAYPLELAAQSVS